MGDITRCFVENRDSDEFIDDEFVDAAESIVETISDIYDGNVEIVGTDGDDDRTDFVEERGEALIELGVMLSSTLGSEYDGANAARLLAHFV